MFLKKNLFSLVQFSFYLIPLSLIIGSTVINFNIILFLIVGFLYIFLGKIKFIFSFNSKILLFFFIILIFSSIINIKVIGFENFFKSIFLLKFFLLYILIENLVSNKNLDIKNFSKITLFLVTFVSLDLILQFFYGKNIFGFKPWEGRITGVFGSEAIAGGFIQKLFLISLIGIYLLMYKNKYLKNFISLLLIISILFASFIASNRMSFLLIIFTLIMLIFFIKEYRKKILFPILFLVPIFIYLYDQNDDLKKKFDGLKNKVINLSNHAFEMFDDENQNKKVLRTNHGKIYFTAIQSFKENKILGSGLKSFRNKCSKFENLNENFKCSTHPHNYHLEILHDAGLLGFFALSIFSFAIIYTIYKNFRQKNLIYEDKLIISLLLLNLLIEIFPIKSTGSIFSTWTGTIFWLSIALVNYGSRKKDY